ncbi:Zn-ribbon domain-containing OB-fold protein [Natrinema soli]|uniref:Zn-ribbon domain-containing OB-fold protein n=1 Tax=Natrinema soli TaxID=1930624 RepID=A0ABD5SHA3_9EURY|nr:Zn-ribbon domain-containing OB-fold protein [Natrinema soli]
MTWEPRPVPPVSEVDEAAEYWKAASNGELVVPECNDCGFVHFYPRQICPECLSNDVSFVEAEGTGTIYSFSISQQAAGWPEDALPLIYATVELEEGPRMVTNIVDVDPDDVEIGDPVEVMFESTEEADIAIPVFTPLE